MKVGFFIGTVNIESGGIAPYAERVLQTLLQYQFSDDTSIAAIESVADLFLEASKPSQEKLPLLIARRLINRLRESFFALTRPGPFESRIPCTPKVYPQTLPAVDLLHVPFQTPPAWRLPCPFITTIHDVQELHFPQYFTAEERARRASSCLRSIRESAAVVVSYEHVKKDLIRFFGCEEDKVHVISIPIKECSLPLPTKSEAIAYKARYSMHRPFFLYPAQTWEHKNHLRLIKAFETVCHKHNKPISLICTGKKNEPFFSTITKALSRSPNGQQIEFTGIIEARELRWLYDNCLGVVLPTLYEAGSFPLIEAMTLRCPVICAATTSLVDTMQNHAFTFDPWNISQIADKMLQIVKSPDFRAKSIENGSQQIAKLSQISVAETYEQLWQKVLSNNSYSQ